jgi:hypothetical protein
MLRQTRLSLVTLGAAGLLLAGVAAFNATIDANNLLLDNPLRGDQTGKYVAEMQATPGGIRYSSEERRIKARLAQATHADCYVIGSSQVMVVNRVTLPSLGDRCKETVNLGVSGSALEDTGMFAGLVGAKDTTRFVLLGIDPWSFKLNQDRRWREVEPAFWQGRTAIGLPRRDDLSGGDPETPALFRLLTYAYLDRNWRVLKKEQEDAEDTATRPGEAGSADDYLRFMPDGTLGYPRYMLDRDPLRPLADGSYRIAKPFIDPQAVAEWRTIIGWLQGRGITVMLMVPPYHPTIWACHIQTVCDGLKAAEAAARELAAERKIAVIGGYDPRPFKLTAYDYLDERHLRPESIRRLEPAQNE